MDLSQIRKEIDDIDEDFYGEDGFNDDELGDLSDYDDEEIR